MPVQSGLNTAAILDGRPRTLPGEDDGSPTSSPGRTGGAPPALAGERRPSRTRHAPHRVGHIL